MGSRVYRLPALSVVLACASAAPVAAANLARSAHFEVYSQAGERSAQAVVLGLERLRALLALHNPLEEGLAGLYAACERLAVDELPALVARLEAAPAVPPAPHFDGPRGFAAIDRLLRATGRDI